MSLYAADHFYPVGTWNSDATESAVPETLAEMQDAALMCRVQAGEQAALAALVDRYGSLVAGVGLRVLHDSGEAQDLITDVFLQVFRKSQQFDPRRGTFRGWVVQIASRKAFDRRAYLQLRRFYENRSVDDFVDLIRSSTNVEYEMLLQENAAMLRRAFKHLSDSQQRTIQLYFFEGYTLKEISEKTSESLENTRHHYYRALERLRSSIQKHAKKAD